MTRLSWNQDLNRKFEFGVDRGVIYLDDEVSAPWNGIVSVTESQSNTITSYYFDGKKNLDVLATTDYKLSLNAFTTPWELNSALGLGSVIPGFILTNQPKTKFDFSYRTQIGNDLGYKIHLVYNATIAPSTLTRSTVTDSATLESRSWDISTSPLNYSNKNPSAHIIFDSTKMPPEILSLLESIIYGTSESKPRLPTLFELSNIFEIWNPLKIEYENSGLSLLVSDLGDISATKIDGVFVILQNTRLKSTSNSGFYRLEA